MLARGRSRFPATRSSVNTAVHQPNRQFELLESLARTGAVLSNGTRWRHMKSKGRAALNEMVESPASAFLRLGNGLLARESLVKLFMGKMTTNCGNRRKLTHFLTQFHIRHVG